MRSVRALAALLLLSAGAVPEPLLLRRPGEIEISATVHAKAFDDGWTMPGYHAIVWKGGHAAHAALLETDVSDTELLDALEALGAKPGDNVPMDAWEERRNPKNPAPDTVIAGPAVQVLLRLPGRAELVPLETVLEDSGGRGLDLRFGGHRGNIPRWKSGCLVCLYSCPGSKIGNARYTMRDYVGGVTRFRVRKGALPKDGTPIAVVLRLARPGAG
jgi:hypothetical protein